MGIPMISPWHSKIMPPVIPGCAELALTDLGDEMRLGGERGADAGVGGEEPLG